MFVSNYFNDFSVIFISYAPIQYNMKHIQHRLVCIFTLCSSRLNQCFNSNNFSQWNSMLSLLTLTRFWLFYLEYVHVVIIYHVCEAHSSPIPTDSIFLVQYCVECHVFDILRATTCLIYLHKPQHINKTHTFFAKNIFL